MSFCTSSRRSRFSSFLGARRGVPLGSARSTKKPPGATLWSNPEFRDAASAALSGLDVACGDLVLVGGEGCQDFGLLALRDLDEIQSSSEFRCDFIEFCRGDPKVPVGLLKAERRFAGLGRRVLEGPTRH